jgi:hypothetical protein
VKGEPGERVIYVWGEPGAGKTHLLKAFAEASGGHARYVPARDFVDAGAAPVFALDDVEKLSDEEQVSLFNAFNEGSFERLLVSASAAPRDVALRRDLASGWPPGSRTASSRSTMRRSAPRSPPMRSRAASGFPTKSPRSILTHARRDMGSLIAALDSLDRFSLETGRPVTVPLLKAALQKSLTARRMKLALFDLDNTLLDGDSDYAWAQFLIEEGVLHAGEYNAKNEYFYERYKDGTLDIHEFLDFQLAPIAQRPRAQLDRWHQDFMQRKVRPMILPKAPS